jgi:BetR domain
VAFYIYAMKNNTAAKEFQSQVINRLREKLEKKTQVSAELAGLFNISNASAYRRISGEQLFTIEELLLLMKHYNLSVDNLLNTKNNQYQFSGYLMDGTANSFYKYLENMGNSLKMVADNNGSLACFNKDIPIFYQFYFPELAWYKFYFWQKHILLVPEYQQIKFDIKSCPKGLRDAGYYVYYNYQQINSTEVWNSESIHTTLRQLMYSRQIKELGSNTDMNKLLNQLQQVLDTIKQQAALGEKINFSGNKKNSGYGKKYQLYYNEFFLADNAYIANINGQYAGFINHSVINYLQTSDFVFTEHLKKHFQNILSKSKLIAGTNEKDREMFFNKITKKINHTRK